MMDVLTVADPNHLLPWNKGRAEQNGQQDQEETRGETAGVGSLCWPALNTWFHITFVHCQLHNYQS